MRAWWILLACLACARQGAVLSVEVDGPANMSTAAIAVRLDLGSVGHGALTFRKPDGRAFMLPQTVAITFADHQLGGGLLDVSAQDAGGHMLRACRVVNLIEGSNAIAVTLELDAPGCPSGRAPDAGVDARTSDGARAIEDGAVASDARARADAPERADARSPDALQSHPDAAAPRDAAPAVDAWNCAAPGSGTCLCPRVRCNPNEPSWSSQACCSGNCIATPAGGFCS